MIFNSCIYKRPKNDISPPPHADGNEWLGSNLILILCLYRLLFCPSSHKPSHLWKVINVPLPLTLVVFHLFPVSPCSFLPLLSLFFFSSGDTFCDGLLFSWLLLPLPARGCLYITAPATVHATSPFTEAHTFLQTQTALHYCLSVLLHSLHLDFITPLSQPKAYKIKVCEEAPVFISHCVGSCTH